MEYVVPVNALDFILFIR